MLSLSRLLQNSEILLNKISGLIVQVSLIIFVVSQGHYRLQEEDDLQVFHLLSRCSAMIARYRSILGEVLLTIMASLAQQESQSLSQNIKLGLHYRYQNGEVQVNHNRFLGYTKDEDGHLIIELTEAEVVKRIYWEYLEGSSLLQIERGLVADGILTAAGKAKWRPETLRKILQTRSTSGMPFYRKSIRWIFLIKSGYRKTGLSLSIMWKTAIPLLFPVISICRCRRKWCGGQTSTAGQSGRKESTAARTLYPVLFTARSAVIFIAGLRGITEGNIS